MSSYSPNRGLNQTLNSSTLLERSLILNKKRHKLKESLVWFTINCTLLAIIIYDLSQTCPTYMNYYHYIEYSLIVVFSLNVFFYLGRIVRLYLTTTEQIQVTIEQKKLLNVSDFDPNYTIVSPSRSPSNMSWHSNASTSPQTTPLNMTAVSWRSNATPNPDRSVNYSPWSALSVAKPSPGPYNSLNTFGDDKNKLHLGESLQDDVTHKRRNPTNLLSSFWSHPVTKSSKDLSVFLKKSQYQLSSQSPTKNPSTKPEDQSILNVPALEVWTRINVDTVALTQWNENLRLWISQTILERLAKEFDLINDSLDKHNMSDIKIGAVGLDRLRKTALMSQINHFIPSLSTIIQFLELHANQEYLVKRIRELARGGCMSEFRWNAGGHYNGKEWDDSLPTDCAIIMHLLASYLDTQLMPSPDKPDTKAFSGHYYVSASDKVPKLGLGSLFVQEVTEKPPHYRVIIGEKIYEMVKGYNNLFHSILFFIYHVNKQEQGMLGRINLGRAGVNMLWIIGLNE